MFRNTSTLGIIDGNSFATPIIYTPSVNPSSVAIGDINGDGQPDLVSTPYNGGSAASISVFRNINSSTSTINFSDRSDYPIPVSSNSLTGNFVSLADFNGDGLLDIVTTNIGSNLSIFRNVQIVPPVLISDFTPKQGPISTTVTITGSGFNINPLSNTVFFGSTAGTVQVGSTSTTLLVTVPYGANYQYISVTNMDTKLTAYSLKPFVVTYPTPAGVFNQFAGGFSLALAGNPNQSVIKDFNGDGRPDIVVGTQSGRLYIYIGIRHKP